jgi:probable rRNA maturation factor
VNLVEVVNGTRTAIDEELVARLVATVLEAEGVHGAEVAVEFVGERRIRELNRRHRGSDEVTDVLSFPLEDWEDEVATAEGAAATGPPLLLGDVVICARRALRQARADALPPSLEIAVLLAHGTLHLLGRDHETDAGQMALRQAEVLELVEWEGLVAATR